MPVAHSVTSAYVSPSSCTTSRFTATLDQTFARSGEKSLPASASSRSGLADVEAVTVILSTSRLLHLPHVAHDRLVDRSQLIGRAELEVLGSGVGALEVSAFHVEGVAGLVDLLAVAEREDHPALEHVAPVGARAAVARQSLEKRRRVDVDPEAEEVDRVAVDFLAPLLDRAVVGVLGGAVLGHLRHESPLSLGCEGRYACCAGSTSGIRPIFGRRQWTGSARGAAGSSSGRKPCCIANSPAAARFEASVLA